MDRKAGMVTDRPATTSRRRSDEDESENTGREVIGGHSFALCQYLGTKVPTEKDAMPFITTLFNDVVEVETVGEVLARIKLSSYCH